MSNIPQARTDFEIALHRVLEAAKLMKEALTLLDRRKATFRAKRETPALTPLQQQRCRDLRKKGHSILRIAQILKTNHGRVSEAINGKAHQ